LLFRSLAGLSLVPLSFAALPLIAQADVVSAINQARLHDCRLSPGPGPTSKLRESSRLNEAARRLANGENLQNAAQKAGYRSVTSASVQITNVPEDRDIERIVARQFCDQITSRDFRDIGTYRRGPDIWVLVAAPFVPPTPSPSIGRRVLELTNEARAHARRCGAESFPAAPPLTMGPSALERAALEHSKEMARYSYLDHTGRDGSTPADRITRTGYKWKTVGENLASGVMTADDVVNGWVGSPHHCANLMTARFTEMAVAFAVNSSSQGGIYWTQVFGTPR